MTTIWKKFSNAELVWFTASCPRCHHAITTSKPTAVFKHCGTEESIPDSVIAGEAISPPPKTINFL